VLTYGIYSHIPAGFLPVEDQGYLFAVIQLPDGASLQRTEAVAEKVRAILAAQDGVKDVIPVTGSNFLTGANQSNSAVEFALLKPWNERGAALTASHIVAALRPKLLAIQDAVALSFDPPAIPGIATTGGFEFEVEDLTGQGAQALNDATQAVLAEARKQPELNGRQLFSTFSTSTPEYTYDLDRTKAKLLGLSLPDVFNTLQIELGSLYVNDFTLFGRTFRVTMQAKNGVRANPTDLPHLYVRNTAGGMIPLSTLGQLQPMVGPEFVSHYNIYGSALINGVPAAGYSSGQAIAAMQRAAARALPADFGYEWTGITYQQLKAGAVAGSYSSSPWCSCSCSWRRSTRAGRCPSW
jgi:multidrug efflux pump subunit AcrB